MLKQSHVNIIISHVNIFDVIHSAFRGGGDLCHHTSQLFGMDGKFSREETIIFLTVEASRHKTAFHF